MFPRLACSRLALWATGVVLTLAATYGAFASTFSLKEESLEGARREGQLVAIALGEQLSATFRSSSSSLVSLAEYFESVGGPHGVSGAEAQAAVLREASDHVGTQAIFLLDAVGKVVASSKESVALDEQTRSSFMLHMLHVQDETVQVQQPSFSNSTGGWVMPVSRSIYDSRGRFQGVLLVYLNVSHIKKVAELMGTLRNAVFTFVGRDGAVLFRHPNFEQALNADLSVITADMWAKPGSMELQSPFDQTELIVSFRRVEAFPALVVVGYARDEVLAGWTRLAWERTLLTLFCALTILAVAALVQRAFIRNKELRQLVEDEVRARTHSLMEANEDLEALSFNASQDLGQPLRQIRDVLDGSQEQNADSEANFAKSVMAKVSEAATRMERLTDEIQLFWNASRAPLKLLDSDVSFLANAIAGELQKANRSRNVQVNVAPEMYATVDPKLVKVLLRALLGNAFKFTAGKPDAQISVEMIPGAWETVFVVRDNGVGFDDEEARKIFKPFERMSTAAGTTGNGMGLPTAQRIVQRHGGRIWVRGKVGEGAAVFFTLQPAVNPLDPSVKLSAWEVPEALQAHVNAH